MAESAVIVAPGDSLLRIAIRTGVSVGALATENGIEPPYHVRAGQKLRIPAGRYHRVKPGETGIAIARAYGVRWGDVVTANQLTPPYALAAGQRLRLPSTESVAAMTLEQRAAAFRINIDDLVTGAEPAAIADAPKPAPVPPKAKAKVPPVQAPQPKPQTAAGAAAKPAPALPPAAAPAPLPTPPAAATPSPAPVETARLDPAPKALAVPQSFGGRFAWPVEGRLLSTFGPKPGGRYNDGVNIKTNAGTPVRSAADGVVAYAGDGLEGFGGLVLIKHGDGWVTAYAHNEELLVARGQTIRRGEVIARAGATGSVDEPQLHFEIRRGRTPVDPLRQLPVR